MGNFSKLTSPAYRSASGRRRKRQGVNKSKSAENEIPATHQFENIKLFPQSTPTVQTKLTINAPGDKYEQEADSVADKVMGTGNIPQVHRKCASCGEEDDKVQRKEGAGAAQSSAGFNSYVANLNSGGAPLPTESRSFFEPRFGHNFSNVRIHNDSTAAQSAQAINAVAYTSGNNIVFNKGQFSPKTPSGQKLLAHELTHVIQQSGIDNAGEGIVQRMGYEGSSFLSETACSHYDKKSGLSQAEKDQQLFDLSLIYLLGQKDAKKHLNWYRYNSGAEYTEDVARLMRDNPTVKKRLADYISKLPQAEIEKGVWRDETTEAAPIRQVDYDSDNWKNANGGIDEVSWELLGEYVPHGKNKFLIKISDLYAWNPDEPRPTQCIHQAMERLKTSGAKEYTTVGEATVTLDLP